MAQLKDLSVSGDARIIGNLYDNNPRIGFGTCSTAADTAVKVVVIDDPAWTLKVGNIIGVQFTNTNTAALVKLNVNNSGAIHIAYNTDRPFINTDSLVCGYAGRTIYYQYDGTYWNWISGGYSSGGGGGEYLPLSGGTMTGQIKGATKGSWIEARDKALIRNTKGDTDSGYHPILSQKTKDGEWSMGHLSGENAIKFAYTTDTDYNNNTNACTYGPTFSSDGSVTIPTITYTNTLSTKYTRGTTISGGSGTAGYFYVCSISNTGTYQNQFMQFDVLQRGRVGHIEISFSSSGTSGALTIATAHKSGNIVAYYVQSNNIVDIYIAKSESYDSMEIVNFEKGAYSNSIQVTWKNTTVTSVPTGYVAIAEGGINALGLCYPIGSIYMSVNATSPANLFGGTWERIQDKFLLCAGSTYGAGTTGGAATHRHDFRIGLAQYYGAMVGDNMATQGAYSYSQSKYSKSYGSGASGSVGTIARNNSIGTSMTNYNTEFIRYSDGDTQTASSLPPYLAVYVWKRTA